MSAPRGAGRPGATQGKAAARRSSPDCATRPATHSFRGFLAPAWRPASCTEVGGVPRSGRKTERTHGDHPQQHRDAEGAAADWFTGDVYIDAVAAPAGTSTYAAALVHFTP